MDNAHPRALLNAALAAAEFGLRSERMIAWPVVLKIDISPLCNLHCTMCVHAKPNGNKALLDQRFNAAQRMGVADYRRIVAEVSGRSCAVSLYYLGDPLVHPDLPDMCAIARQSGLNSHVTTNFSFYLPDHRLRDLADSGLTHLTVCIDGLTQDIYSLTRIGGSISLIISNLRRLCEYRKSRPSRFPRIEVQYIKFAHNLHQLAPARTLARELRVDQFSSFWGGLNNYTDVNPGNYDVFGPAPSRLWPRCVLTHMAMLIKWNGDVIPCCNHRQGVQYTDSPEKRILGNVFATSVWEVWNSPGYRALRRFVGRPGLFAGDAACRELFCWGCPTVCRTNRHLLRRHGGAYTLVPGLGGGASVLIRRPAAKDDSC